MRILYCNKYNFPFSGTEVYLFELMNLMRTHGHEVALFSMADPRGEATPYDQYLVPWVDFKDPRADFVGQLRLAAHAIYCADARFRLRRMIQAFRPDIAHVRNIYHHLSPSILWELRAQRIPVLYHINDFKLLCPTYNLTAQGHPCEKCSTGQMRNVLTAGCYEGSAGSRMVLAAEGYFQRWSGTYQKCVDRYLAPSRFVKKKLIQYGWRNECIEVLPHFHALPEECPFPPSPEAPILYFGRLSPEKGVSHLLRAMQRNPEVQLQIAGDGPSRPQLEAEARGHGLSKVEFLGHVAGAQLNRLIAASRFTVFPSLAYETFGKSILESLAHARPVIASDLGSRRELVEDGQNGLLYPPGDAEQLAARIAHLVARPGLAAAMGKAGRELVRTNYQPAEHYQKLAHIYEEMLSMRASICSLEARPTPKQDPIRIAFIGGRGVAGKYSGIETYCEEMGERLANLGYEVTVYCRSYFTPKMKTYRGIRVVRLPSVRSKHLETFLHTLLATVHVTFSDIGIVHYQCLGPALFSYVPRIAGKKTIVTVQGLDWKRRKWGWLASAVLQLGEYAAIRFPNATVTVSRSLQDYFRAHYGRETRYVPNGTTLRKTRSPLRLSDWGLQAGNYILFLGRFSPEKNCDLLIDAYKQLNTKVKLVLAGGSSHTDHYADSLRKRRSDKIIILDWVSGDDLAELLTNAMIFVLPSDLEGLSLALLEAMGAGVCAVASDIPENRELLEGVGHLFTSGDQDALARILQTLISDPHLRRESGQKARQRIRSCYLWDDLSLTMARLYDELTGIVLPKEYSSTKRAA